MYTFVLHWNKEKYLKGGDPQWQQEKQELRQPRRLQRKLLQEKQLRKLLEKQQLEKQRNEESKLLKK